jgi:hypothetical protein
MGGSHKRKKHRRDTNENSDETKKPGKDQDIAELLASAIWGNIRLALLLLYKRYGRVIVRKYRDRYPGLSRSEREEIIHDAFVTLALRARDGKFESRASNSGSKGLLDRIIWCDCADRLRRKTRSQKSYRAYYSRFKKLRLDEPHKLTDAIGVIIQFADTRLKGIEQTTLIKHMRILQRKKNGEEISEPLERVLVDEVTTTLADPDITADDVLEANRSALRKARLFLENGDSIDE